MSVIPGTALRNVLPVHVPSRALLKQIATSCGRGFFFFFSVVFCFGGLSLFFFNRRAYGITLSKLFFENLSAEIKCKRRTVITSYLFLLFFF